MSLHWTGLDVAFRERFATTPTFWAHAPGRVNLIGEHTDYNEGFVLPSAVNRYVQIAGTTGDVPVIRFHSLAMGEDVALSAEDPTRTEMPGISAWGRPELHLSLPPWGRYVQGVALHLIAAGVTLRGLNAIIGGDLPIGAGLGSSAALEIAAGLAMLRAAGHRLRLPPSVPVGMVPSGLIAGGGIRGDGVPLLVAAEFRGAAPVARRPLAPPDPLLLMGSPALGLRALALLSQRAETDVTGAPCGVVDQFAVTLTRPAHAMHLDCRTLEVTHVPMPVGATLVICDTGVRHDPLATDGAERRRECAEAVRLLRQAHPGIAALRDVTPGDLGLADPLPETLRRRVRHVVRENRRVRDMVGALEEGDLERAGELLDASHASLRDDYAVSAPALEAMVQAARSAPGLLGARLAGEGFGGAVLALVREGVVAEFVEEAGKVYRWTAGRSGTFLPLATVGGADVVP